MSSYYTLKHWLKLGRWRFRRSVVHLKWGSQAMQSVPAVIGNAMPKSGSHLIIQVLQGLVDLGPFVNPGFPPLNRSEDNRKLNDATVLENIQRMRSGDIAYGYIQARQPFISVINDPGKAMVFVYRDPRDMIVSHVFYATQMYAGHGMHEYYQDTLQNMEQRIDAAIRGVDEPGSELSSVAQKYQAYLGWLEQPGVLSLRFEDLILDRPASLGHILEYLEGFGFRPSVSRQAALETLAAAIAPRKSGTFRKGQPGNWREHFTEENKYTFKQHAGDLLIRLGYEPGYDW